MITFAETAAHLLADKIKEKIGCAVCEAENDPKSLLFWSHHHNEVVDQHDAILMKHTDVLEMSSVCLSCVIEVSKIKVPPIRKRPPATV